MRKALTLLAVISLFFASCGNTQTEAEKTSAEKRILSREELNKDYQLVYIQSLNQRSAGSKAVAIDAYGLPVQTGKWYVRSSKSKMIFPYVRHNDDFTRLTYGELSMAQTKGRMNFIEDRIYIDTTQIYVADDLGNRDFGIQAIVEMICFSKNHVTVQHGLNVVIDVE